ncbi:MAG: hypothetical protein GKR90_10625 [Pseudomonadales bacterium]|nr:hypothetical protein [Pseudomonadales bacterium]
MRQLISLLIFFSSQLTCHGVYGLEPGYPDLVDYDFTQTELYLHRVWIDKELDHIIEAEFLIKPIILPNKLDYSAKSLRGNDGLAIRLSHMPKRGWNHGDNVGDLVALARHRRPVELKAVLYQWLSKRLALDQFEISRTPFRGSLTHTFPRNDDFRIGAEILEVKWASSSLGLPHKLDLHVIDLHLN